MVLTGEQPAPVRQSLSGTFGMQVEKEMAKLERPSGKLKIIIGFCQVVAQFGDVFDLRYPPHFASLLATIGVFNMDAFSFGSSLVECTSSARRTSATLRLAPMANGGASAFFARRASNAGKKRLTDWWRRLHASRASVNG